MLLLGWFVLGKNFVFTTILSSVCYPLFLDFFQRLLNGFRLTDDTLLSALFAGLFVGAGVGLVLRMGASSGGMDSENSGLHKGNKKHSKRQRIRFAEAGKGKN